MSAGGVSHGGETVRLTAAQAMVRYLAALRIEHEGRREPLFGGVFAIFGHGNVAGLGEALYAHRQALPTYRAHNEQAMAHAAIAYAKAHFRQRMMACTTSIGPGATNLVTAAALAHVNRLPVLFIPGDVFASRAPDPVLQQVEDFHAGDVSANDCFRPVSRWFEMQYYAIGKLIAGGCYVIGWFMPYFFAGKLESGNVCEYFVMMRHFRALGIREHDAILYEMGMKEKEHELYFLEQVKTSRLLPWFEKLFSWGRTHSLNDVDLAAKYPVEAGGLYCPNHPHRTVASQPSGNDRASSPA